jgi:hypothetical protein
VTGIRRYFSEIYQRTGAWSDDGVGRVALVVASRLDAGWLGVTPAPRFTLLPMTALTNNDISEALKDLAGRTDKNLSEPELEQATAWLGDLSVGVPELLASCLRWIEKTQWRQLDFIADDRLFRELGHPFVHDRLLSPASLLPLGLPDHADQHRQVVEYALRLVAPYRIFTQSHLRQHLAAGGRLAKELTSAGWSLEDLWNAIAGSALLDRPQDELWQRVQPTIRELLFRTFYKTDELRTRAQLRALAFDRIWSQRQQGIDQVAGLAECIWHEALALRTTDADRREARLMNSARALAGTLRKAEPYSVNDLRHLLAVTLRNDDQLNDLLSDSDGALDRIIHIMTSA